MFKLRFESKFLEKYREDNAHQESRLRRVCLLEKGGDTFNDASQDRDRKSILEQLR